MLQKALEDTYYTCCAITSIPVFICMWALGLTKEMVGLVGWNIGNILDIILSAIIAIIISLVSNEVKYITTIVNS